MVLQQNDIAWVIKRLEKKIIHTHVKDVAGRPGADIGDGFIFPLLGEGSVKWNEFFSALDAINYKGFLSIEFESFNYYRQVLKSDPVKAAEISKQQLDLLLRMHRLENTK